MSNYMSNVVEQKYHFFVKIFIEQLLENNSAV